MGLSSSQGRYLMLTARKNDLEFQGQQINQARLSLANQQEEVSTALSNALSNRTIVRMFYDSNGDLQEQDLSMADLLSLVGAEWTGTGEPIDPNMSEAQLIAGLMNGTITLINRNGTDIRSDDEAYDWQTNTGIIHLKERYYTEDDAAAEAEYKNASAALQRQDKTLELQLKNVDTQHNAVQTEIEAVKKVIDKNIEMSFKTFA